MTPNPAQQGWSPPGKDSLSDPGSRVRGCCSQSSPSRYQVRSWSSLTKAQVLYCQKDTRRDAAGDEKQKRRAPL